MNVEADAVGRHNQALRQIVLAGLQADADLAESLLEQGLDCGLEARKIAAWSDRDAAAPAAILLHTQNVEGLLYRFGRSQKRAVSSRRIRDLRSHARSGNEAHG